MKAFTRFLFTHKFIVPTILGLIVGVFMSALVAGIANLTGDPTPSDVTFLVISTILANGAFMGLLSIIKHWALA